MKSILELFAQDEIKVDTRDFNYTTDYLDKFKKRQILEEKIIEVYKLKNITFNDNSLYNENKKGR